MFTSFSFLLVFSVMLFFPQRNPFLNTVHIPGSAENCTNDFFFVCVLSNTLKVSCLFLLRSRMRKIFIVELTPI